MQSYVVILILLWSPVIGRSIFSDMKFENSPFPDTPSIETYLSDMARLNEIQSKIFGIRPVSRDQLPFEDEPTRPDQIPYLFEGDIVLTNEQLKTILKDTEDQLRSKEDSLRKRRSMISYPSYRWTKFPIPYYINTKSGVNEAAVLAGIRRWEADTCVTFTRVNDRIQGNGLEFFLGSGCYSMVGRVGSRFQQISIGYGCASLGIVTHEIGHSLGYYHEQSRYDRDSYVKILPGNIQNGYVAQFTKQSKASMADYGVGYDYGSVMHYDQFSFSQTGRYTIQTLDTNYQQTIGQRDAPSFMDVKRINLAYCNNRCKNKLRCFNGGYTDPKNCNVCRCPTGLAGKLCDQAAPNPSACGNGYRAASSKLQTISVSGAVRCSFAIQAPAGHRVYYEVPTFRFTSSSLCSRNYLEIKYVANLERTGARFCKSRPNNSVSRTNVLIVLYKGSSNAAFTLKYRYDPVTQRNPIEANDDNTTTTDTITEIDPSMQQTNTSEPTEPTNCTAWTDCSAECGGCGKQTRICNNKRESRYCNMTPCDGDRCCRPFLYVNEGFCFNPNQDEPVINETINIWNDFVNGNETVVIEGSGEI